MASPASGIVPRPDLSCSPPIISQIITIAGYPPVAIGGETSGVEHPSGLDRGLMESVVEPPKTSPPPLNSKMDKSFTRFFIS